MLERSDSLRGSNSLKEAFMGILRDRMIEEMKLRNFSPATQESYVYAEQTGQISPQVTGSAQQGEHPSLSCASYGGTEVIAE